MREVNRVTMWRQVCTRKVGDEEREGGLRQQDALDPPFFWPRYYLDAIQLLYHLHTPMMMHLKRVWKRKALLCALVRLIFVKNCCEFSTIQKGLEM